MSREDSHNNIPYSSDSHYMIHRDLLLQPIHKKFLMHDSILSQIYPCLTVEPASHNHVAYQTEEHLA